MSELILTGAPDPGILEMGILAVKGDPGVVPLDQTNTFTAVQNFAAGITIPAASLPVSVISGLSSALTSYETIAGSTARVNSAVQTLLGGASAAYDTLGEIQALLTSDESTAAALATLVGTKAPINNPTFTGTVTTPFINSAGISGTDFYLGDAGQLTLYRTGNHGAYYNLYVDGLNRFNIGTPTGSQTLISGLLASAPSLSTVPVIAKGVASQSADLQQWQNSAGTVLAKIDSAGSVTTTNLIGGSATVSSLWSNGGVTTLAPNASSVALLAKGVASQAASIFEVQNSAGSVLAKVNANGLFAGSIAADYVVQAGPVNVPANYMMWTSAVSAAHIPLAVRGAAGQTANITEWQNSAGTNLGYVDSNGQVFSNGFTSLGFAGPSAMLRIGTAATKIAAIIKGAVSQSANLTEWQDSAGTVQARVDSSGGNLFAGSFQASVALIAGSYAKVGTITTSGTAGLTVGPQGGVAARVVEVLQGVPSQTGDLTQWQDSTGAVLSFIGAGGGANFIAGLSVGAIGDFNAYSTILFSRNAGRINTVVRGAISQSNSLMEWQDSSAVALSYIDSAGALNLKTAGGAGATTKLSSESSAAGLRVSQQVFSSGQFRTDVGFNTSTTGNGLTFTNAGITSASPSLGINGGNGTSPLFVFSTGSAQSFTQMALFNASFPAIVPITAKGAASQSANLQEWQNSAGTLLVSINAFGDLVSTRDILLGNSRKVQSEYLRLYSSAVGNVPAIIQGFTGQTGDLQQWQSSAGTVLASIDSTGSLFLNPPGNGTFLLERSQSGFSGNYVDFQTNLGASVFKVNSGGSISLNPLTSSVFLNANNATNGQAVLLGNNSVGSTTANHTFWGASVAGNGVGPALKAVPGHAAQTGLLVQGFASQSANLQEWQNSAGTLQARVTPTGVIGGSSIGAVAPNVSLGLATNTLTITSFASSTPFVINVATGTNALQKWQNGSAVDLSKVSANGEYENTVAGNAASDAGGGTGGIVLKSPDGTRYRVTVANGGTLAVTAA